MGEPPMSVFGGVSIAAVDPGIVGVRSRNGTDAA